MTNLPYNHYSWTIKKTVIKEMVLLSYWISIKSQTRTCERPYK